MSQIGVIGLGAMGAPIARNLLKRGHTVSVFARRPEAMAPLVDAGAHSAASPADVAERSDIIITVVFDSQAVEDVTLGSRGIVEAARPGAVVVDHTTIHPNAARRIAAALGKEGIEMLDAPVSGGAASAEAGELTVMAGGAAAALQRSRPIIECYAATITHIGPSGAGQVAKACNQICTIVNMLGAAEALLMAERSGIDPAIVKDVMMKGFAASRMLDLQGPKMIARDFSGKVQSRLHHKDIQIVLEMARDLGLRVPASSAAAQVLAMLQDRGGGSRDSAAIFEVLADL
jgi:3-hydroxyisobutyrate dehydrogenase-like beta-hydroxyacid dehydrogenase